MAMLHFISCKEVIARVRAGRALWAKQLQRLLGVAAVPSLDESLIVFVLRRHVVADDTTTDGDDAARDHQRSACRMKFRPARSWAVTWWLLHQGNTSNDERQAAEDACPADLCGLAALPLQLARPQAQPLIILHKQAKMIQIAHQ